MFSSVSGPLYPVYSSHHSPKVLTMSNHSRRRQPQQPVTVAQSLYSKVEQEISEGYLEVEITGMSFRRLVTAYAVLVRHAWQHTLGGVRSLLRVDPATQA